MCQRFLSSSAVNVSGEKSATDSDHSAKDGSGQGKESGGGEKQDQKNDAGKPVRGGVCVYLQLLLLAMWICSLTYFLVNFEFSVMVAGVVS